MVQQVKFDSLPWKSILNAKEEPLCVSTRVDVILKDQVVFGIREFQGQGKVSWLKSTFKYKSLVISRCRLVEIGNFCFTLVVASLFLIFVPTAFLLVNHELFQRDHLAKRVAVPFLVNQVFILSSSYMWARSDGYQLWKAIVYNIWLFLYFWTSDLIFFLFDVVTFARFKRGILVDCVFFGSKDAH